MSSNKVEMSLDDIIKENKSKGKGAMKGNRRVIKATNGILGRGKKIAKPAQKDRLQKGKASNTPRTAQRAQRPVKRVVRTPNQTPAVATKRLVQKLVKKALARSNLQTQAVSRRVGPQRPKFRGSGRVIRKTVVVNRLKLNPRSRVISRRARGNAVIQKVVAVRGRGQARFAPNVGNAALMRRVNYAPVVAARPVMVQAVPRMVPRMVIQQPRRQRRLPVVFQASNIIQGRPSVRDHISQLRTGGRRQPAPEIVYVTRPQGQQRGPRQQEFRQQVSNFQPQQRRQLQRRNNFSNQRPQQFKTDPFFEPPNFLQRLPVARNVPQNAVRRVRRY
uniref:Uncharacterized protein n=1 Tax=Ditylenchus dipsaci TaxID=166011 RepID=A0A915DAA6_9BILA